MVTGICIILTTWEALTDLNSEQEVMDASRAKNTKAPHYEVQELAIEGTLVSIIGIETHPTELIALKQQKINKKCVY